MNSHLAHRRRAGPDGGLGRRRVLLAALPATPARRRSPACPTPSTCSTTPASPTRDLPSLRYVTQAGGRLAPDRVRAYAELGQRAGLGLRGDVRPDRGHRPDGLPARRSSPPAGRRRSASPIPGGSLRIEPVAEATEPGVGELVYEGPNVMLGYAESAGRPGRGPHRRRAPDRRPGADLRRPGRDRRAPQPSRQGVRPAARPGPGRGHRHRPGPAHARCGAWRSTTCCTRSRPGRGRPTAVHAELAELCGLPRLGGPGPHAWPSCRAPPPASPTTRRWSGRPGWSRAAPAARRRAGRTGHGVVAARRVRPGAGPSRRRRGRQLRRPRRRLAVLRRAGHPARPPDGPTAAGLAHPDHRGAGRAGVDGGRRAGGGWAARWTPPSRCGPSASC